MFQESIDRFWKKIPVRIKMSVTKYIIRRNQYFDSVFLMGINKDLLSQNGVIQSAVLMGTQNNKQLLADIHVSASEIDQAGANDLIVAVIAESEQFAEKALGKLDQLFEKVHADPRQIQLRTFEDGLRAKPGANLAVISVPGEFAAREAMKALEKNLNVFIFSSNVSVEDELKLKEFAMGKNLLVMGPDCGTSIIAGKGIGFANRVRKGPIGVIGPSGTGLQEFTCLIHHLGSGISHAIGTGTRDLKDVIGGLTTLTALEMLEKDKATRIVVIISKPVDNKTQARLMARLENYRKPVVACFLGSFEMPSAESSNLVFASTIDEAAEKTILISGGVPVQESGGLDKSLIQHEADSYAEQQKFVRGLFAGGTFCYQAQQILLYSEIDLFSNEPLEGVKNLPDPDKSTGNALLDMGNEYYTLGKPHPMIDGTMRSLRIAQEASDPETAIILLDFILGFNASNDPVGEAIDSIIAARQKAESRNRHLTFVASITGTEEDPQDLTLQRKMLEDAQVIVTHSSASAAKLCAEIINARKK
jgi:FdrA protein